MYPTVPNGGNLTWAQRDDMIMKGQYSFVAHPCQDYPLVRWA
jgi:hypothetical protein